MDKTLNRVAGGISFADALRNSYADTKTYVGIWIEKVLAKNECKKKINYFVSDDEFIILFADNIVIRESFKEVENLRCQAYDAFENWLTELFKKENII